VAASHPLEGISTRIAVFSGPVAPTLLDVARDEHIDLIVMSSHGYSGFKRWALGSITQKIIRHSPIPVLLLGKQGYKLSGLSQKVPHTVRALVALDGSPFAETALHPAAALVAALSTPARGELHLTQLVQLPTLEEEMEQGRLGIDVDIRQSMLRHAGEYMEAVREQLHRKIADSPMSPLPGLWRSAKMSQRRLSIRLKEGKTFFPVSPAIRSSWQLMDMVGSNAG
jgi:nucleotide-binding universal stress UspA family protein